MGKTSEIKLNIELDEDKMPVSISWEATDAGFLGKKLAKTMMLSLWDDAEKITYSIDLWTKDMLVEDMKKHFHQILLKMADTFNKATNNTEAAGKFKKFADDFLKGLEKANS